MKRLLFLSILIALLTTSCYNIFGKRIRGDGNVTSQSVSVSGFNSIDVSGAIDVYVKQDSSQSVKIETDANLFPYLVVREENGVLKIYPKNNYNLRPTKDIKVYVSAPEFRRFEASGACDYYSQNKLTSTESMAIDLSGSSDAKMELNSPKIVAGVTGAGKLTLQGETKDLSIDGTGSSTFKCYDMMAENVDVDITGSGDAEVFASVKLDVSVSGSGTINYKGNARVDQKVSGSGTVKKVD